MLQNRRLVGDGRGRCGANIRELRPIVVPRSSVVVVNVLAGMLAVVIKRRGRQNARRMRGKCLRRIRLRRKRGRGGARRERVGFIHAAMSGMERVGVLAAVVVRLTGASLLTVEVSRLIQIQHFRGKFLGIYHRRHTVIHSSYSESNSCGLSPSPRRIIFCRSSSGWGRRSPS